MKIIFMGTPDFAEESLLALLRSKHEVAAVFTNPDKPKGRGLELSASPVKKLALANGIPVFQPKTLKTEEAALLISELSPDCIVVAAYGKILPKAILSMPRLGCVNVHGSILPKYRGAAPIQHCVLNGESETGITTMLMNEGVDTGDILLCERTPIGENETSAELFSRLSVIGGRLLIKTLDALENGELTPIKQDTKDATYAPMLKKEMSCLDFTKSAATVHNTICGLSDWPCATAFLQGKRMKIYHSTLVCALTEEKAGTILDENDFIVACGDGGIIRLCEVQGEGSKRMDGGAFLRGKRIKSGEIFDNII